MCKHSQPHVAFGFHAADPPRITTQPRGKKDAVPGNLVVFTIQAIGTEPLNYQWERKIEDGNDVERIPGANSSTLTIPSVQKSNEGSYHCTVTNCAGSETSQYATLTVGKNCSEERVQFIYTLAVLTVQLASFQGSPQKCLYFLPGGGESLVIRLQFKTLDAHFHCIVCSARTQLQEEYQYIYCVQTITTACCLWFPCS